MTSPGLVEIGVISAIVGIIVGLIGIAKVIKDQGKLEGATQSTLSSMKESVLELRTKLESMKDSGLMTYDDHTTACTGVTIDFNRQIKELNVNLKQYAAETQTDRERNIRLLTRLETILEDRIGKGRRTTDHADA